MRLLLLLLTLISINAGAAESHCAKDEVDYISCTLDNSKVASICGTHIQDPKTYEQLDNAWIQYRIGKINQIEFVYPESKSGSIAKFEGNDFHPHGEDHSVLDLRFVNKNARYSFTLTSGDNVTGSVSAEINRKRSAHFCRDTISSSYSLNFQVLIWALIEQNGQTDIFYESYKKQNGK